MTAPVRADFRSDTRTLPDTAMRAAMAAADVGDDAYGDDPTVRELEAHGADLLGKPAALFLPSATMANLIAILAATPHTAPHGPVPAAPGEPGEPGDGPHVIAGDRTHITRFEATAIRRFARATLTEVPQLVDGTLDTDAVRDALTTAAQNSTAQNSGGTPVVCSENTAMLCDGNAQPPTAHAPLTALALEHAAHLHLDGARLANAAVALGSTPAELAAPAHSVTFCLAKGLGAPAGSLLAGTGDFIDKAREIRLGLGGTMHQSGILAAAGLHALHRIPHLADDHALAALLARELARADGADVPTPPHRTNIVTVRLPGLPAPTLQRRLADHGILVLPLTDGYVRFVVHHGHDTACVQAAAHALTDIATRRTGEETPMTTSTGTGTPAGTGADAGAPAGAARNGSGTDWQSWQDSWDRQQQWYMPHREEQFRTMLDMVQACVGTAPRVLDLACGTGTITARLLARFPQATVTGIDLDPALLTIARGTFEGDDRVRFVEADLTDPAWPALLPHPAYDAVLTATALHWLRAEPVAALYGQIAELVRPGGVFMNADRMTDETTPRINAAETAHREALMDQAREQGALDWSDWWRLAAKEPALAEPTARRWEIYSPDDEGDMPSAQWHARVLREKGFAEARPVACSPADTLLLALK